MRPKTITPLWHDGKVPTDDDVPARLLVAAAALLGSEGPGALTTRRLAAEAGTSTMAVYTHFGGLPALVRAVVADGFARLRARVAVVPRTDDSLHDLTAMAGAYLAHARAHPDLYAVMFGTASLGGYRLTDEERAGGLTAFQQLVDAAARCVDDGRLRGEPTVVAGQLWLALHGYVMAELAGYQGVVDDPETQLLWPMLAHLVAGLAADPGAGR